MTKPDLPRGGETSAPRLKSVCVYCGTGEGVDPAYMQAATGLGRQLAQEGLSLVYGGGSLGLMGAVANAALEAGGHVTGVIPAFLEEREVMMQAVSELDHNDTDVLGHRHKHFPVIFSLLLFL